MAIALRRLPRAVYVEREMRSGCIDLETERSSPDSPVILFFAPEAGIRSHFVSHCVISKTLQELGYRVLIVRCHGGYSRCVVYDGFGLPVEASSRKQKNACTDCLFSTIEMTTRYGLESIHLGDVVDEQIETKIGEILEAYEGNFESLEYEGIKFGEVCSGETARYLKIDDAKKTGGEAYILLREHIRAMLLSYFAIGRLFEKMAFSHLVYFNEYAVNLGAALACKSLGVATVNMTQAALMSVDRRRIVLIPDLLSGFNFLSRLDEWDRWRDLSLSAARIQELMSDLIFRMRQGGSMVYSPTRQKSGEQLAKRLGLSENRKLLVAFTSSLDEIRAESRVARALGNDIYTHQQPFESQIEWLKAVSDWVECSSDLELVVRVHPREGPNKREKRESEHLSQLREEFSRTPNHVHFVWPEDDVSSYDLIELADVGMISWSSLGVEMARVGIPVVAAFNRISAFPIDDFIRYGPTREAHFEELRQALDRPPSLESMLGSLRWLNLMDLGSSVYVGDVIPRHDFVELPPFKLPEAAPWVEKCIVQGELVSDLTFDAMSGEQSESRKTAEREMLRRQLRRCIRYFCTGRDIEDDYVLAYRVNGAERADATARGDDVEFDAVVRIENGLVHYRDRTGTALRRAPLIKRLLPLCAQA